MGIEVRELFDCNIFQLEFDYDEWPGTHTDEDTYLRPYNGSIYDIRHCYKDVFPEEELQGLDPNNVETDKVYKIKYSLNLLT
jgi:hypothetical protein